MRGRKPIPSELKRLAGNPGKRPLNEAEPRPRRRLPRAPEQLSDEARAEWRRVARELYDLGLLTGLDRAALAMYCESWATWIKAEQKCAEDGDVVLTSNGNPIMNPYRAIANRSLKLCQSLAAEFGMTPSSRTRVKSDQAPGEKSLAEQLFESVKAARERRQRESE